jgi:hypothetical protein
VPLNLQAKIVTYGRKRFDAPEEVVDFLVSCQAEVPVEIERDVIGIATAIREELWGAQPVRSALRDLSVSSARIDTVFRLLGCYPPCSDMDWYVGNLLLPANLRFFGGGIASRIITRLHRRGVLSAENVLLPRLGYWSSPLLWEEALPVFRVCAPSRLSAARFRWLLALKSPKSRTLLSILTSDLENGSFGDSPRFRRSVLHLSRHNDDSHTLAIVTLAEICFFEGPGLARRILTEMLRIGDHRDVHLLLPHLAPSTDQALLTRAKSSPNVLAANWARATLP